MEAQLFTPFKLGDIGEVSNRMALAPMTRGRATPEGIVGQHHVDYYTQRATAGLIITEGTFISHEANGWWRAPYINTLAHADAWKPVTASVHKAGGKIICQLWHCGRVSISDLQENGQPPVAPSAIKANGDGAYAPNFVKKPYEVPRALETSEIPRLISEYVNAAKLAIAAGFDGVEIHDANGYLLDEFLQSYTNKRTDKYGGSVENRVRLLDELLTAVTAAIGSGRVGIRFSPNGVFNDMGSEDNIETFTKAIEIAAAHNLAFVHILDGLALGFHEKCPPFTLPMTREIIRRVQKDDVVTAVMGNCGYTKEAAEEAVSSGKADMISFGRPWIANPDLVRRFKENIKLTEVEGITHWYMPNSEDVTIGFSDFKSAVESG